MCSTISHAIPDLDKNGGPRHPWEMVYTPAPGLVFKVQCHQTPYAVMYIHEYMIWNYPGIDMDVQENTKIAWPQIFQIWYVFIDHVLLLGARPTLCQQTSNVNVRTWRVPCSFISYCVFGSFSYFWRGGSNLYVSTNHGQRMSAAKILKNIHGEGDNLYVSRSQHQLMSAT